MKDFLICLCWLSGIFLIIFIYVRELLEKIRRLKKSNSYLNSEVKIFQKIIFDLNEHKEFLMKEIIAFKKGHIPKSDLFESVKILNNEAKKEIERERIIKNLKNFYNK
jgi:hypothetical protein